MMSRDLFVAPKARRRNDDMSSTRQSLMLSQEQLDDLTGVFETVSIIFLFYILRRAHRRLERVAVAYLRCGIWAFSHASKPCLHFLIRAKAVSLTHRGCGLSEIHTSRPVHASLVSWHAFIKLQSAYVRL